MSSPQSGEIDEIGAPRATQTSRERFHRAPQGHGANPGEGEKAHTAARKVKIDARGFLRSPAQLSPFTDSPRQFEPAIGPIVSLGSRDSEPGLVSWDLRHCASRLFF